VDKFLCGFLNIFGLKVQHLNLNSVLKLAAFMTLYEGFLGIEPDTAVFLRLVEVRGQPHPR
jgi:hypothetical protein